MIDNINALNALNSPIRNIEVEVEATMGASTHYFTKTNKLKSLKVERVGESGKFFGFGIVHKLTLVLVDTDKEIKIDREKVNEYYVAYIVGDEYVYPYPYFELDDFTRDENTNTITITAYDILHQAKRHTFSEVSVSPVNVLNDFVDACGMPFYLGFGEAINVPRDVFYSSKYMNKYLLNYDGTETIKDIYDDIAEYTQTVYYLNSDGDICFKRLDKDAEPVFTIDKSKYFTLTSNSTRTLREIVKATSLGDNVAIDTGAVNGETQYIKDNGLYELIDANTLTTYLNEAIEGVGGLAITPFECEWRGNVLLEVGDKIALTAKDNSTIISFLLDDVTEYTGGLNSKSRWAYEESKTAESPNNSVTLGDALKQTYAKVDKTNKQIEIVADETAMLKINADSITNTVTSIKEDMNQTNGTVEELTQKVEATLTADEVNIAIQQQLADGVNSVTTTTGFTFNQDGLTVSKSGSEMSTTITEDGMQINKDNKTLLTVNNEGVEATNLFAKTYLIIGTNSRFEDYNGNRTGCFWIA